MAKLSRSSRGPSFFTIAKKAFEIDAREIEDTMSKMQSGFMSSLRMTDAACNTEIAFTIPEPHVVKSLARYWHLRGRTDESLECH